MMSDYVLHWIRFPQPSGVIRMACGLDLRSAKKGDFCSSLAERATCRECLAVLARGGAELALCGPVSVDANGRWVGP